jgi:hypothetical protein
VAALSPKGERAVLFARSRIQLRVLATPLPLLVARWSRLLRRGLQLVAERIVITALQAAFLALPFTRLYQVFNAPRTLDSGLAAFAATMIALHTQLVLALSRYLQVCELINNRFSHGILGLGRFPPTTQKVKSPTRLIQFDAKSSKIVQPWPNFVKR